MAVKVSSSRDWEPDKIIEEIKQPNIKVVIYFFSPSVEQHNPHTFFSETFPEAVCVGSSMHGGWSSGGAVETGIAVMSLSSDEVDQTWFTFHEGVKKNPVIVAYSAIIDLLQKTSEEKINPDEYLGLIFFDGLCLGEMIMKEFSMEPKLNMAFIGGAAADEMNFKKTTVSCGNELSEDGLVAVILKMKIPFFFNHYSNYIPTDIYFKVTRVDIMQRIVWEINDMPAADFYAQKVEAGSPSKLTPEIFAKNPVGLKLGESVYIRSPKCVVDGGGLQFYCYIEAGTRVFLLRQGLKQGDIVAHTEKSIAKTSQFLSGVQGCIIFNNVQRYLEIIEKNKINEFNNVFEKYPMIGFNTFGEELFTHHNQTLTAVFFGTLPEPGTVDPYKAKRLFHYTDSKLKSVVFDIVSRTELLNSTVSFLKKNMNAGNDSANYEVIKKRLGEMVEQSDISRQDIERMLVVYRNNVERTGEYVFNIVEEIKNQNRRLVELKEDADTANRTKSDFIAKPINTGENESAQSPIKFPLINGIDVQTGINMTGGTVEGYYLVLSVFLKEVKSKLKFFNKEPVEKNLFLFTVNVHALKSAAAAVGAAEISAEAESFELAGKEGDIDFIKKNLGGFTERLSALIKEIKIALELYKIEIKSAMSPENVSVIYLLLMKLKDALISQKTEKIDLALGMINKQSPDVKIKEVIENISGDLPAAEYENAIKKIEELLQDKS